MSACKYCDRPSPEMYNSKRCLECQRNHARLYRARYLQKPGQYDRVKAAAKAWRLANPVRRKRIVRDQKLKQYGLSPCRFEEMKAEAAGSCQCCRKPSSFLYIDHCHVTGRVRGLLCPNCNSGLGNFKADTGVDVLEAAIRYIKLDVDKRDRPA